jgi:ectoine hydroxylase-related dioxygenase (phytanoyl-CoA dioxygenase family)
MGESVGDEFATHGWVLVPDVIDTDNIAAARRSLQRIFPTYEEFNAAPAKYSWAADGQFGGLRLWPLDELGLDLLPLDPRLVEIAEGLIGSHDIRLLRAGYQAKDAGTVDFEQVHHYDYPNHSLVVPPDNDIVGFFLYLSDVTDDLGPSAVVSDSFSGPVTPDRTHLDPQQWPDHYKAEHRAIGGAGSVLAYRSTTYHRGTAITASAGLRMTLGFTYGKPAPWTGYTSFPRLGEEPGLKKVIASATPRMRELLGFPARKDPYWNSETVAAIASRYPGFDPAPYLNP